MGIFSVCLVFGIVLSLAVDSGSAVPRHLNPRPTGIGGLLKHTPLLGGLKKSGAGVLTASRGLIGDDISWFVGLPLQVLDFILNVPVQVVQAISSFTDIILRYFLGAGPVDFIDFSIRIIFFPLRLLWWGISIPARFLLFVLPLPFRLFILFLDVTQIIIQKIFGFTAGASLPAVSALYNFLKAGLFGPIGNGVEDLILDVYLLITNVWDWLSSDGPNVVASRRRIVSSLSDTMNHLIATNNLLKGSP